MKFFIFGGIIVGAVILLIGIWLFADHRDYVFNGIRTPGTVVGFEEGSEQRGKPGVTVVNTRRPRTIYYPVIRYSFRGQDYEHTHESRQYDERRPFAKGQRVTLLCSAQTPDVPFVGTFVQFIMSQMLLMAIGLGIMLVCGVMGFIAWMRGDLEDRPVQYVTRL